MIIKMLGILVHGPTWGIWKKKTMFVISLCVKNVANEILKLVSWIILKSWLSKLVLKRCMFFACGPMQNTCKVQGGFNKNLKYACCFDINDGCINLNISVNNFQPYNLLLVLTDRMLAHHLCCLLAWLVHRRLCIGVWFGHQILAQTCPNLSDIWSTHVCVWWIAMLHRTATLQPLEYEWLFFKLANFHQISTWKILFCCIKRLIM